MIYLSAMKAGVVVQDREPLTSGMSHVIEVGFSFSADWAGLMKTAVFTNGSVTVDVPESAWKSGCMVSIPHEVLTTPGKRVRAGVYGTDGESVVLPTVWAELGAVLPGVEPSGDVSTSPSLPVWAQIQAQIGDLSKLETLAKRNLVEAINEAAKTGSGGGGNDSGDGGGSETPVMHSVTWTLEHVTQTGGADSIADGAVLSAVLTAEEGYDLGEVVVTMGGAALSGVWDADTSTLRIPAVTGDVTVRCTGVEHVVQDTSPEIAAYDKGLNTSGEGVAAAGLCYTKVYPFTQDIDAFKQTQYYDAENDYATLAGALFKVIMHTPRTKFDAGGYSFSGFTTKSKTCVYQDDTFVSSFTNNSLVKDDETYTASSSRYNTDTLSVNGIAFTLSTLDAEDSYAYWGDPASGVCPVGVRAGDIIFAGKNTQYYGLANIDGTPVGGAAPAALTLDEDVAQDYTVATTSLLGQETAADSVTAYGLASGFAAVVDEARKAWMMAYGGDWRKIPIIVTTDQHGRRNQGLFNMLGKVLSMYDLSRVINLGDTLSDEWIDADTEHPLLRCAQLEAWCESVKGIPMSRQLNVFGNHDTWYHNYADEGNPIGTRYPSTQQQLNQYFRNIYARRTNNNGWFAVTDDAFNVKYVVISGFEYKKGESNASRVSTEQMTWLIEELSKNDGYDVVLVSHVPLHHKTTEMTWPDGATTKVEDYRVFGTVDTDAFFSARRDKTAGTVTDSDGVQHSYDFTDCKTQLLCALHGHTHIDAYNYVGSLLSYSFDWFDDNTVFFALIDREAQNLHIWKVEGDAQSVKEWEVPMNATESSDV